MQSIKRLLLCATVFLIAACGGGGGGGAGGGTTTPLTSPVREVIQKVLTTASTYTATSTDGLTLSVTFNQLVDGRFSAATPVSKVTSVSSLVRNASGTLSTDQTIIYFNVVAPFAFVATEGRRIDTATVIPETAVSGASGQMYLSNGNGRGLFGIPPLEGTWSVEPSTDGKLWVCVISRLGYGLLSAPGFESTTITTYCFKTDATGTISGFKASIATDERSTSNTPVVDRFNFGG